MQIVMQVMTKMKDRDIMNRQIFGSLGPIQIFPAQNSSSIPDKDDDGSDPELSFDDIDDDEDMIEIEQALEGLVGFT